MTKKCPSNERNNPQSVILDTDGPAKDKRLKDIQPIMEEPDENEEPKTKTDKDMQILKKLDNQIKS